MRFRDIHFYLDAGSFKESEHPRGQPENAGQFVKGGSGSATSHMLPATGTGKERTVLGGGNLPAHILALKLPPAWTDVKFNPDPDAALLAIGKDSKGRPQYVYSAKFAAEQSATKFARIHELNAKFAEIQKQNKEARLSNNPRVREAADCAALIMAMGIRPGSDTDTQAKVKAYGATTLEGKHVVETKDGVRLAFTGKKGVAIDLPVRDRDIAKMLLARKARAGEDGRLFKATDKDLLDHVHSYDGGGFKTKDFRTLVGTRTAMDEVSKASPPKGERAYKKAVMDVAKVVASRLGNTPTVALQSYISPTVFAPWRMQNDGVS